MTLPAVPAAFHWTEEVWGAALRCGPLEDIAPHLFTTRQLQLTSADDLRLLGEAVGARNLVMLTQVHGRGVTTVHRGGPLPAGRPEGDVIVSDAPAVGVAVRAADCVPLLMADAKSGVVAAVHAGWRGTAARAAVAAVEVLASEFGAKPDDLVVAIGPSIGSCCYEVGPELVDAFAAAGHERYLIDRWFQAPPPRRGTFGSTLDGGGRPKMRLDVAGANRDQLVLAGVREDNIHSANLCTAMHLDVLTSYRAEKEKAGRIAGVIARR